MTLTILADDLTGACDTGSLFAGGGPVPVTVWPDVPAKHSTRVVDTETRPLAPAVARDRVRAALRAAPATHYFKKIDSTLRGRVGAEVEAMMAETGAQLAVLCPAFPAQGRTVVDGILRVEGRPVAETPLATDPQFPARVGSGCASRVADMLRSQVTLPVSEISLGTLRAGDGLPVPGVQSRGAAIAVADAETDADLELLVAAALERQPPALLVGSAGLGGALARRLGLLAPPVALPPGQWLVVVGSLHPASRRQAEHARGRGLRVVASPDAAGTDGPAPENTVPGSRRRDAAVAERLAAEAVKLLVGDESQTQRTGVPTPSSSRPLLIAATGGDTALAIYRALDAERLDLVGSPATGLALGRVHRRPGHSDTSDHLVWLLTKAGGFGPPDIFLSLCVEPAA